MATPMGGGYNPGPPQVSLDWLSQGWNLFRQKPGVWIGATLVYFVVVLALEAAIMVPTGLFANMMSQAQQRGAGQSPFGGMSPFMGGGLGIGPTILLTVVVGTASGILNGCFYRLALRRIHGEDVTLGDFFNIGDVLLPLAGTGLIMSIATSIGYQLCCLPGFFLAGLLMFAPLLVVDRKLSPFDAISTSINMLKQQWLMAAVFLFVGSLLAGLGVLLCCVGCLATVPMLYLGVAFGYTLFNQPIQQFPGYGQAMPGTWPPPPGSTPPPPLQFGQPQFGQSSQHSATPPPYTPAPPMPPQFSQPMPPPDDPDAPPPPPSPPE